MWLKVIFAIFSVLLIAWAIRIISNPGNSETGNSNSQINPDNSERGNDITRPVPEPEPEAIIKLSEKILEFDKQEIDGEGSQFKSITITNTGTANLNITSKNINNKEFSLGENKCDKASIASQETCEMKIKFQPQTAGDRQAKLTINHNAANSPFIVKITGNGVINNSQYQPDLAADAIDFDIIPISPEDRFRGTVKITGRIKNVGLGDFQSQQKEKIAELYEIPLGGKPRLLEIFSVQSLAAGQETKFSYTREWNSSSPAEGEWPPKYELRIVIKDNNLSNNIKTRDGSDINDLFRRQREY
ncbi:MAG: choice-of-anchor D domain-containing protein [Nostoc sp. LLA-1]|nr:choice-of-anchor D domain-containing protein [Cyanocohniella sp. LLY]